MFECAFKTIKKLKIITKKIKVLWLKLLTMECTMQATEKQMRD